MKQASSDSLLSFSAGKHDVDVNDDGIISLNSQIATV